MCDEAGDAVQRLKRKQDQRLGSTLVPDHFTLFDHGPDHSTSELVAELATLLPEVPAPPLVTSIENGNKEQEKKKGQATREAKGKT